MEVCDRTAEEIVNKSDRTVDGTRAYNVYTKVTDTKDTDLGSTVGRSRNSTSEKLWLLWDQGSTVGCDAGHQGLEES